MLSQPSRNYVQSIELASRSLSVGDAFQMLYANNGALVFTVEAGIFGDGTQISLCKFDVAAGLPVFAAGAGVTLNTSAGLGPTAQFTVASIIKVPTDLAGESWIVTGSV